MLPIDNLPEFARTRLQFQLERWQSRASAAQQQQLQQWVDAHTEESGQLARLWVASDYAMGVALDQTAAFLTWLEAGSFRRALDAVAMMADLDARLQDDDLDERAFDRHLRQFRRDHMLRILWRDFCGLAQFQETARDMSHLAEVTLQVAIAFHYGRLQTRFGTPMGKLSGSPQPMVALGMGKLGGYELNVSSDIDLIFTYPESGDTEGGRKCVSNQEFFIKLGQKVIASLDANTVDGFVFRVDMRLRPYGDSGALVLNFDAMEEYYQTQGREWERYAMIKARVVSGDVLPGAAVAGRELMAMLQPFTYRRYVDFSAIESMRAMKELINREVQRRGVSADVKLGAGGIREIEFVVQVFQMIRGGRDPRLHERSVLKLLPLLEEEGYLPPGEAERLARAYVFLRDTEHALQGYRDRQTQSLPDDDWEQQRLAWLLGYDDWHAFGDDLAAIRAQVNLSFQNVIAVKESPVEGRERDFAYWEALWPSCQTPGVGLEREELVDQLQERGVTQAGEMAEILIGLRQNRLLRVMQPIGLTRLDQLMPRLLAQVCKRDEPAETLRRCVVLVEAVARRSAYFLLLVENPDALAQLVSLCGASSLIAEQLVHYPSLLDELLDVRRLYQPPARDELADELRQQMMRVAWDDTEGQLETLRYFHNAHSLIVAASEVAEVLPLMKVSDYLTWLAEVILEHVLNLAWRQMLERHGRPRGEGDEEAEFIILGYGKLGGLELGHGSDLDLVFLYDAPAGGSSDGAKPLDNQTWFTRLGQKIIHILTTQTLSGTLYEVDMRLRPSGNSGLLVSSLAAFAKYQREQAWTWEHQALIRARVVAGGARLGRDFEALRDEVLRRRRDTDKLHVDVVAMREKMRAHLGSKGAAQERGRRFHLKQDAGGIVDIEFIVQYAVLVWAHKAPALTRWTDNIRILETLQQERLLRPEQVTWLTEAYKAYRATGHRLALQRQASVVSSEEFCEERAAVQAIWKELLGDAGPCRD